MEVINSKETIDVEALKSRLRQKKTMSRRFRLSLTKEEAIDLMLVAVQNEVEFRQRQWNK